MSRRSKRRRSPPRPCGDTSARRAPTGIRGAIRRRPVRRGRPRPRAQAQKGFRWTIQSCDALPRGAEPSRPGPRTSGRGAHRPPSHVDPTSAQRLRATGLRAAVFLRAAGLRAAVFLRAAGLRAAVFFRAAGFLRAAGLRAAVFLRAAGFRAAVFFRAAGLRAAVFLRAAGFRAAVFFRAVVFLAAAMLPSLRVSRGSKTPYVSGADAPVHSSRPTRRIVHRGGGRS